LILRTFTNTSRQRGIDKLYPAYSDPISNQLEDEANSTRTSFAPTVSINAEEKDDYNQDIAGEHDIIIATLARNPQEKWTSAISY